jgi:zinc transporter ZupT
MGQLMQPLVVAGVLVVAAATLAGVLLARRGPGRQEVWFGAAAGALLVIAGVHLLPDAWSDAREANLPPWLTLVVAAGSAILAALIGRFGCTCAADREHAGGTGTAAALAGHRFLEGAALALTASIAVTVALAVHALGEGLAVGALLHSRGRRHLAVWLTVMCLGPIAGAAITDVYPLPAPTGPLLVAFAAGILAEAARISLRAAFGHRALPQSLMSRPVGAVVIAAAITTLAVHATG